jgi:hypothetical protein
MITETITHTRQSTDKIFLNQLSDAQIQNYLTTYNSVGSGYSGNMSISSDNLTFILHRSFDTVENWVTYRNILGSFFPSIFKTVEEGALDVYEEFVNTPGNITLTETVTLTDYAINNIDNAANLVVDWCYYNSVTSNNSTVVMTSFFPTPNSSGFNDRVIDNLGAIMGKILPANGFSYTHSISVS